MTGKTNPEKKRHHYIPITYLENFTDSDGKIHAYFKDEERTHIHVRPDNIAFERYYYSQPLPGGGRDNATLENFFSTIETKWPRLVAQLRSGASDRSEFEELCTFLSLMRVRAPAMRDLVETSLAEHVKATARHLDEQGLLPPKPAGFEDILDHMAVAIDPHQSLHAMGPIARGFGLVLNSLGFEVLKNETSIDFITSDNPVIYFDPTVPENRVIPYQVRPPYGSVELLFPIDRQIVLKGRTGPAVVRHGALRDRQEVKRINRAVARFGYRFVFAANRSHDALIAKYADTAPVLRTKTIHSEAKGPALYHEYAFGARPVKPKWKDEDRRRVLTDL